MRNTIKKSIQIAAAAHNYTGNRKLSSCKVITSLICGESPYTTSDVHKVKESKQKKGVFDLNLYMLIAIHNLMIAPKKEIECPPYLYGRIFRPSNDTPITLPP